MSTQCLESHEWMSLGLDGCLSPEEEKRLQAHLSHCPDCAQMWQRWQEVGRLFAAPPMVQPPVDLAARVWGRIEQRQRRGALLGSLALMTLGLAVLIALYLAPLAVQLLLYGGVGRTSTLWPVVQSVALQLWQVGGALGRMVRIILRAVVDAHMMMICLCYALAAIAVAIAWLRVAVFRPASMR